MNTQLGKEKQNELDERLTRITPSPRQLAYEELEFIGFIHFTVNTFTGREWGDGTESEEIFNPTELDAKQWVKSMKAAGIKGLILTCKHHDGFCLWPSAYTTHTVASSPYKDGKGNIVRELSDACREENIAFGIYLSPWDRNNKAYGTGKEYDDFFINQLTELLTNYGKIFCVWFDGACGEGPNGKKQVYDWDRYYEVIRRLQPEAVISVCGPDVRWCGNEAGDTREAEWSVVPARCADTERIKENSQKEDDDSFRQRKISASDRDLGSREILRDEDDLIWYPAEVNTSIRPGWFYHPEEDDKVRSLQELKSIYIKSVGGNANFLLNVPPDKRGLIADPDVARLKELGEFISKAFENNIAEKAALKVLVPKNDSPESKAHESDNSDDRSFDFKNVLTNDDSYFKTRKGERKMEAVFDFKSPRSIGYVVLQEQIMDSQRIEDLELFAEYTNGVSKLISKVKTVGHKRIIEVNEKDVRKIIIKINDARQYVTLKFIGIYEAK